MNPIDIVILAVVGALVATIIGVMVYKKVVGKGGDCGCGCGCSSCSNCPSAKKCSGENMQK